MVGIPPNPRQHHQPPCSQHLSMSSGQHWEKPSVELGTLARRCPCSLAQPGWMVPVAALGPATPSTATPSLPSQLL